MIKIKFKKLRKSEAIINTINERIEHLIEKFPNLLKSKISITVEMENSPIQAGPDLFKLKLLVSGGKYDAVTIEKCDPNLYAALADVCDHMLEALNPLAINHVSKIERKLVNFSKRSVKKII